MRADDARIRYIGWFDRRDPRAPRCAWPGSQIVARFTGTSLYAKLTDTPVDDDKRETDWITVVVDDAAPKTFALAEGLHVYPLATRLDPGAHTVLIWKRTEADVGTLTFHGFVLDQGASIEPMESPRKRRIVFIGDSITAGYGNEGTDSSCHWSARRENNYQTFGAFAARALQADYLAAAWSGKGILRNYEARDRTTFPELYDRIIPTDERSPLAEKELADVVVINLGTNDVAHQIPSSPAFVVAYRAFVASVRERFPGAFLLIALGPMLADDYPQPKARSTMRGWLKQIVEEQRASGNKKIDFVELWTDPAEGLGCDSHPNVRTHARLGREIATLIRERLGW